ncbi:hypothetical protein J5J83_13115 [Azoarcus sp. L1K30]|uniref:hypothetical protein n=1 Tax=Azoarcus sp. L1K30 TaxID=2820277 RepID=UPI001B80F9C3|nr:hypothetical protein [Azoarcus sp. L1K30]MBR0567056.1 hypothetical protein [Azoarcus sp. L1K30]
MDPDANARHRRTTRAAAPTPRRSSLQLIRAWTISLLLTGAMSGCAVVAVADAAVTVVATTVKVGAKVVGAGVDVILPDDEHEDE